MRIVFLLLALTGASPASAGTPVCQTHTSAAFATVSQELYIELSEVLGGYEKNDLSFSRPTLNPDVFLRTNDCLNGYCLTLWAFGYPNAFENDQLEIGLEYIGYTRGRVASVSDNQAWAIKVVKDWYSSNRDSHGGCPPRAYVLEFEDGHQIYDVQDTGSL